MNDKSMMGVPVNKRPYGYLLVKTINSHRYTTYNCEMEVRSSGEALASIHFKLIEVARKSRYYSLLVYTNADPSSYVFSAKVHYTDCSSVGLEIYPSLMDKRFASLYDPLIRFIHAAIYHSLLQVRPKEEESAKDLNKIIPWYIGFTKKMLQVIEDNSPVTAQEIVAQWNNLPHVK